MAQWSSIAVPLSGGLDTKTDSKVVLPTKMTVLENAEFTKGGSVKKRPGYSAVRLETTAGLSLENPLGLGTRGSELLVLARDNLYSYDTKTSAFQDAGDYVPMTWTADAVVNSAAAQTRGDCATNRGITVYAWQDSRGGVRYAVFDATTGAAYAPDSVLAASNAAQPKVVAVNENIVITYLDTSANNIKFKVIRPGAITASLASAVGDLAEDYSANSDYDVIGSLDSGGWVLYEDSANLDVRLRSFTAAGAATGTVVVDADDVERPMALAYNETTGRLLVGYAETSTGDTTCLEYTGSSLTVTGISVVLVQSNTLLGISLAALDDGGIMVWASSDNSSAYTTSWAYRNAAGTTTTGSVLKAVVCTSGWGVENDGFVILAYDSPTGLQDSYFMYRHDGIVCGRLFYQEGNGTIRTSSTCFGPRVSAVGDGTYQCVLEYRRGLITDKGATKDVVGINARYSHVGLRRVVLNPEPATSAVNVGNTLYMGGSMLWAHDGGVHPVEANPLLWPEMLTSSIASSGSSAGDDAIPIGPLNYRVFAEIRLANGQVVRSAAITRLVTTANDNRVNITIPCIPFTRHTGNRADISFAVYRSELNKSDLYYRISSTDPTVTGDNGYTKNDPTAASVVFVDNLSDALLITREIDYQSRGELPHFAPDGTSFLGAAQSRLFSAGGGTKPNAVTPSLLRFDGEPAHFNDSLTVGETPDYGGDVVGTAPLNDVLVVFKERAVYALAGNGPDNTGQQGFFESRAISSDMGCTDPGSIVSLPIGVMFKSRKGFYLLTPEFQLVYVGADVEAYNSQTFAAGAPVPDSNQVIFVPVSGYALVFDWYYKSWSTHTNHAGIDALVWKEDTFVYLRNDGKLFFRDNTLYTDGGSPYSLRIRTAPIRLEESVQGYWLCGPVNVLGDYKSLHRLAVGLYYDRDESPFETFMVEPAGFVETATYGDDTPYGNSTYYGGSVASGEYQFQIKPRRSKVQTIRFEFRDTPGELPGSSYEITELLLKVGVQPGIARLPASRKV